MSDDRKSGSGGAEAYLMPYRRLLQLIGFDGDPTGHDVHLTAEQWTMLIGTLLKGIPLDEAWYLRQNPDVADAIASGLYRCGKQHFIENGYFEDRKSGPVVVDAEWYLRRYPDVAEGVEVGEIASAQRHFEEFGEAEDRLPREW